MIEHSAKHRFAAAAPWLALLLAWPPLVGAAYAAARPEAFGPPPFMRRLTDQSGRAPSAPMIQKTVWTGVDIDGDGAPDFANPTGQAPRVHDSFGAGGFGASRDGGTRAHEGVDYAGQAGQAVAAPLSGYVTKIGYAYAADTSLTFVEVTNPALGWSARAFYVDPQVAVGQAVRLGQPIGRQQSLQGHYPGITDHVHLEVMDQSRGRLDAARLIQARIETVPRSG